MQRNYCGREQGIGGLLIKGVWNLQFEKSGGFLSTFGHREEGPLPLLPQIWYS